MVMQKRVLKHHINYHVLSTEQYGLGIGLQTDNAIYKLATDNLNAMSNKLLVGGIFCDLDKAFDCIDHDSLLFKLKSSAINTKDHVLHISCMDNRYCRTAVYIITVIRVIKFQAGQIQTWSPTMLSLGPLLFLLYRVFHDLWTLLREMISQVFVIKKFHINVCPILDGYGVMGVF